MFALYQGLLELCGGRNAISAALLELRVIVWITGGGKVKAFVSEIAEVLARHLNVA